MSSTRRATCRLCDAAAPTLVVPLPRTTLADHYRADGAAALDTYPLDVYQCQSCWHVQLLDVVDPAVLFHADFTYMPSNNPQLRRHFESYARLVHRIWAGGGSPAAIDLGSNDGLYLDVLRDVAGARVMGLDPARGPVEHARSIGVETVHDFLTDASAATIRSSFGLADLVSANNVYAHTDDLDGFTRRVVSLMAPGAVFSFEFSYLVDVVEKGLLGTFFHEHLSTHSVTSLVPFLERHGLHLIHLERVDTQGGAAIGVAGRRDDGRTPDDSVASALELERALGLGSGEGMSRFRRRIEADRERVRAIINASSGARVVGFGAARSANLLVDYFELAPVLSYVVDDNPSKLGKVWNTGGFPIRPTSALAEDHPDIVVCLAWIHTERITSRLKQMLPDSVRVLQLYPEVRLV